MKISIGSKLIEGPWGGGNLFVKNLANFLISNGHSVVYDLCEPDINLILLTDPRNKLLSSSTFNHKEIKKYKKYINKDVKIVQRINECDERKNTNNVNDLYLTASEIADKVIFVSSWLKDIYINLGLPENKSQVILAGADRRIFNSNNSLTWNEREKLKLVTHHWSSHELKGFDDYKKIDEMLDQEVWNQKIKFTYIGNVNENYSFNNIKIIKPLSGIKLASEIKKHHFYLTSSINEPSGNHHIEAAQCGLPIIYKSSGGIPEYCQGFGIEYLDDVEEAVQKAIKNYKSYKSQIKKYPNDSLQMSREFMEIFENLIEEIDKNEANVLSKLGKVYLLHFKFKNTLIKLYFIIQNLARRAKSKLIKTV
jgi:glycosyltransferase involved in cell wall biosynthesis